MASPLDSEAKDQLGAYKPYSASREQLELYNAALNLQRTANVLTTRLRADRTNYDLAAETYDVMLELITTVIEMNSGFALP